MSERIEILISGFGGQGVVRTGQILGYASVLEHLHTTMLVSHGTETRGGYVRSQVVISDAEIDSPVVEHPDVFCAMSKAAYDRFHKLSDNALIFFDPAYVTPAEGENDRHISIPAKQLALDHFGNDIFANMIMYGRVIQFLNGKISEQHAITSLKKFIPKLLDKNVEAFQIGYHY